MGMRCSNFVYRALTSACPWAVTRPVKLRTRAATVARWSRRTERKENMVDLAREVGDGGCTEGDDPVHLEGPEPRDPAGSSPRKSTLRYSAVANPRSLFFPNHQEKSSLGGRPVTSRCGRPRRSRISVSRGTPRAW